MEHRTEMLRERTPQKYGLLVAHFSIARQAIEQSSVHYPTARQLYEEVDEPEIPMTTFGYLLTILADLGLIQIHKRSGGRNRYDLTESSPAEFQSLEETLQAGRSNGSS
jgi:hypothetical protein